VKYGHEALQPGRELLGGLADHCLLTTGTSVVRLPQTLPLETACPASCATATIAAALSAAGAVQARSLLVYGAGLLGLTACAMLRTAGAAEVLCVETEEHRRQRALEFGATRAIAPADVPGAVHAATGGCGVDAVIELSGAQAAFESAWPQLRLGGTLVLVGAVFPGPPLSISMENIVRRNITIRGVHNYAPGDLLTAVEFLAAQQSRYPFAELVAQWFPLSAAAFAFDAARVPRNVRVGVRP
jgi:alcohol dehydrogenase